MASRIKDTTAERLASIEARFDAFMKTQNDRHAENTAQFTVLQTGLQGLQQALARYTGFWGAILLVGAAVGTVLTFFGDILRRKLGLD